MNKVKKSRLKIEYPQFHMKSGEKSPRPNIRNVLFVCNGNIYRSFSAECLLKHYLNGHNIKGWEVFSAGTTAKKQKIDSETIIKLKALGVKDVRHKQHKLNKSMLKMFDLVIAMAEDQIDFMKKKFNYTHAVLFNKHASDKKRSIGDISDNVKDYMNNRTSVKKEINRTIQYIHDSIPGLIRGINKLL